MREVNLRIEGMHCGSCIRRVTQSLQSVAGAEVEEVRLGAARIQLPEGTDAEALLAGLGRAGFKALEREITMATTQSELEKPTTITIPVIGMSCAACQSHVERALRQTPGVTVAEVNLMTHTARVSFDPLLAQPQNLVDAVKDSGYESSLPLPPTQGEVGSHPHQGDSGEGGLRLRALLTLGLAAAAMLLSMPLMRGMHTNPGLVSGFLMKLLPMLYQVPDRALEMVLFAMALTGMALGASEVYKPAWNATLHRTTNMNTLVALGTIAALFYSAVATFAPSVFIDHGLRAEVYYESILFILAFLMLGRWLEARAKDRTQDALQSFLQLQPQTATLLRDGKEVEVPLASVGVGDTVVLRPGERVPLDGVVLAGSTSVDESLITGESLPVVRGPGDRLTGGSLNYDGAVEYRTTSLASGGTLAQMLSLMQQAQSSRAPTQQLADRVSAIFVPVVLGIAAMTFLAWLAFDHGNLSYAFAAAVTVLVIACPCAMGLAVPAALTVAIGRGAQLGILFKSGDALERLASVDTVVLDKTGTLTEGRPYIDGIYPLANSTAEEMLRLTASLEQRSEHPLARAIVERAAQAKITLAPAFDVRAIPGKGITASIDGHLVAAGNLALLRQLDVAVKFQVPSHDASTMLVAVDGQYCGYFTARTRSAPAPSKVLPDLSNWA